MQNKDDIFIAIELLDNGDNLKGRTITETEAFAIETILNSCKNQYHYDERKRICKNCGQPFIATKRTDTYYCDRISPQDPTRTCKQYGADLAWWKRTKDENDWYNLYRKIYQSFQAKAKRNPDKPQLKKDYEKYKKESREWKKAVKAGTKTDAEFMSWLQKFRKNKINS